MELEAKHYDTIMDCLDEFDFERVHKVMTFLDWAWADGGVPDVLALRRNCRTYLQEVVRGALERKDEGGEFIMASGGFRYEAKLYPDDFLWLRMSFTIEDWDNAE
jgi:hypothetical protein